MLVMATYPPRAQEATDVCHEAVSLGLRWNHLKQPFFSGTVAAQNGTVRTPEED